MDYTEQAKQIEDLAKSIIAKSQNFANQDQDSPWYQDLTYVISELIEVNDFLK